jgi:hypothetical protein
MLIFSFLSSNAQSTHSYPEVSNGVWNDQGQYAMEYYYQSGIPIGYILAGSTFQYSTNKSNIRIMAKDFNGNTLWTNEGQVYGTFDNLDRAFGISYDPVSDCYLICGYKRNGNGTQDDLALLYIKSDGTPIWYNTYNYIDPNSSAENSLYGLDLEFDHISQNAGGEDFIIVGFQSAVPVDDNDGFINPSQQGSGKGYFAMKIAVDPTGSSIQWEKTYIDANTSIAAGVLGGDLNRFSGFNDINYDAGDGTSNNPPRFYVTGTGQFYDPSVIWGASWGMAKVFAEIDETSGNIHIPNSSGPDMSQYYSLLQSVNGYRSYNNNSDHYILGYSGGAHGYSVVKCDNNGTPVVEKRYQFSTSPMDVAAYVTAYNIFQDPNNSDNLIITGYMSDRGAYVWDYALLNSSAQPFVTKINKITLDPVPSSTTDNLYSIEFPFQQGYWWFPSNHYFANNTGENPLMYAPQHSLPIIGYAGVTISGGSTGVNTTCEDLPTPPLSLPTYGFSWHNGQFNNTLTMLKESTPGANEYITNCCLNSFELVDQDPGYLTATMQLLQNGNVSGPNVEAVLQIRNSTENHDLCAPYGSGPNTNWKPSTIKESDKLFDIKVYPNPVVNDFFTISSPNLTSYNYELQSISGDVILSGKGKGEIQNVYFSHAKLCPGVYFIKFIDTTTKSSKRAKLIIE